MKRLLFLLSMVSLTFVACDPCNEVNCMNGGTCEEGECNCPPGFSGDECEDEDLCITSNVTCENGECQNGECVCEEWWEGNECEDRVIEKYDGLYVGTYSCTQGTSTSSGNVNLQDIDELDEMKLIESTGRAYTIEFQNETDFDVPTQIISYFGGQETVSGDGEIDGDDIELNMTYTSTSQGSTTTNNCTFIGSN